MNTCMSVTAISLPKMTSETIADSLCDEWATLKMVTCEESYKYKAEDCRDLFLTLESTGGWKPLVYEDRNMSPMLTRSV